VSLFRHVVVLVYVLSRSFSYHLKIKLEEWKPLAPFKFNYPWLIEEDFRALVTRSWKIHDINYDDYAIK
jgi:hypothetical protein